MSTYLEKEFYVINESLISFLFSLYMLDPMGLHLKNNANQPLFPFLYRNGNQQYIHRVFMCISKKLHGGACCKVYILEQ